MASQARRNVARIFDVRSAARPPCVVPHGWSPR
jgi:hypothetical protein